jgi:hypothetical protein
VLVSIMAHTYSPNDDVSEKRLVLGIDEIVYRTTMASRLAPGA